jgi:plastocyanin
MRKIYINPREGWRMQITFIQTTAALAIAIIALLLLGLVSTYTTNSEAAGQGISENVFQLSAKLDNSVNPTFRWVNTTDGVINPTLNFKVNTNNLIHIQNPTQTLHQLIIDFNGKQIATSGDITSGSSGQVSVKPNMTGTFGYHCLYHPDTMKGIIQVH